MGFWDLVWLGLGVAIIHISQQKEVANPKIELTDIKILFNSKSAGLEQNEGKSREHSENKANPKLSPAPLSTHQPKARPSCRKRIKRPNYNYKPINHHFKPSSLVESESSSANKEKIAGNEES